MSATVRQGVAEDSSGKPKIRRVLRRWDLILFGLVMLGPTAPYPVYGVIQQVSHGQAALGYIVAMVAMLFTATSYARMAGAYPSAGSTYTFVTHTFTPWVGFFAGWAMILDYFLIPLESIIYAALTAARLLPSVSYFFWLLLFTLGIMLINVKGIRLMSQVNIIMMAVMAFCAILFIVLAIRFVHLHFGAGALISMRGIVSPGKFSVRPMMLGASIAALSYIGFDAISTLAEDTVNPEQDIGFSTILVCIIQTVICVVTVYLAALVWNDYRSFPQAETAILDIGHRIGGQAMFLLLTLVLLVAAMASALTGQAGASRLLFAMGRDGVLPPSLFGHISPRFGTPVRAIYLMSAASLAGALLMNFEVAVELLNFGAFVGFILVNLSVIQHFYIVRNQRQGRSFLQNLVFPLLGASVSVYVWMNLSNHSKLIGFLWLAAGAAYLGFQTRGFKIRPCHWKGEEIQ